jgi:hypothetical protein
VSLACFDRGSFTVSHLSHAWGIKCSQDCSDFDLDWCGSALCLPPGTTSFLPSPLGYYPTSTVPGKAATMIVESIYCGYRIEVNAIYVNGVWDAEARIRRLFS